MNTTQTHTRGFDLRYYEMDRRGLATPITILSLLEESAFTHCEASGWDLFRLQGEGLGWVLLRLGFEMRRYPAYRERFRVETWCSSTRGFYGTREYRLVGESGAELGYARTLWVFFDTRKRRPRPVLSEIVEAWKPDGRQAGPLTLDALEASREDAALAADRGDVGASESAAPSDAALPLIAVRQADIDANGHVNNLHSLSWALASVPAALREGASLRRLLCQFKREVLSGSTVMPLLSRREESFDHKLYVREPGGDSYLAVAARSSWESSPEPGGLGAQSESAA